MLVVLRTTVVPMKPLNRNVALIATLYVSLITSFQPSLTLLVNRGAERKRESQGGGKILVVVIYPRCVENNLA